MKIQRIQKPKVFIPTASMADIAFLLIIFFMLTTVFRKERGIKITMPEAQKTQRILKRKNLAYIWVSEDERIYVMDKRVNTDRIAYDFRMRQLQNPNLITMLMIDRDARYSIVDSVMDALRQAKALRITFSTEFEE